MSRFPFLPLDHADRSAYKRALAERRVQTRRHVARPDEELNLGA